MSSWKLDEPSPTFSFLGLVQFDCCLRPSEALQLCRDHVVPPVGARYNCWTIIVKLSEMGERTKTGTADDSVVVGDIPDRRWMNKVMKFLYDRSTGKLFARITLANYERALADACKARNYSAVIVLLHILRHSSLQLPTMLTSSVVTLDLSRNVVGGRHDLGWLAMRNMA